MWTTMPEWFKGLAALFTSIGGLVVIWAGLRKKKTASTSTHALGAEKASDINLIIHNIVAAIEDVTIVTIVQVVNGGPEADPKKPKRMHALTSTDYATWLQWKKEFEMEPKLVNIHAESVIKGECVYSPAKLDNPDTQTWAKVNGVAMTSNHRISVNDLEGYSIILIINYSKEHEMNLKTRNVIRIATSQLGQLYEPAGWLSKKKTYTE